MIHFNKTNLQNSIYKRQGYFSLTIGRRYSCENCQLNTGKCNGQGKTSFHWGYRAWNEGYCTDSCSAKKQSIWRWKLIIKRVSLWQDIRIWTYPQSTVSINDLNHPRWWCGVNIRLLLRHYGKGEKAAVHSFSLNWHAKVHFLAL